MWRHGPQCFRYYRHSRTKGPKKKKSERKRRKKGGGGKVAGLKKTYLYVFPRPFCKKKDHCFFVNPLLYLLIFLFLGLVILQPPGGKKMARSTCL